MSGPRLLRGSLLGAAPSLGSIVGAELILVRSLSGDKPLSKMYVSQNVGGGGQHRAGTLNVLL